MTDQIEFLVRNFDSLVFGLPGNRPGGLILSILLSVAGLASGLVVASVVASGLLTRSRVVRTAARLYTRTVRGIPLILLLVIVHQMTIRAFDLAAGTTSLLAAYATLVLYASAYQADIIESGLRAVPATVVEDAVLLGARPTTAYYTVTLPYGARIMVPALLSQAITLFKDSSVVVILGVAELTTTARIVLGSDVTNAPYWVATYLTVGALYFVVAFGASRLASRLQPVPTRTGLVATVG